MSKPKLGKVVKVLWGDAWSQDTQEVALGSEAGPIDCELVGYLVSNTPTGVMVAWEYFPSHEEKPYRGVQFVPAGMVKKVISLE